MLTDSDATTPAADRPFELKEIAPGVYAALGLPGGSPSNAGIVDLGDRCLILDAPETPQAAEALRVSAERLTGHGPLPHTSLCRDQSRISYARAVVS